MVRRLEPCLANVRKRLVKSPKIYVRDSGLLHALLGLATVRQLQGHPMAGASWEGFVVEQVAAALPTGGQIGFYRTAAGAETDLVVEGPAGRIGIEIKFSASPMPTKGFWQALQDLAIEQAFVVAPCCDAIRWHRGLRWCWCGTWSTSSGRHGPRTRQHRGVETRSVCRC